MSLLEIQRSEIIRFRRILVSLLFLQGVTYAYFLHATVRDVVRVEDAEKAVSTLNSQIGAYEGEYLSLVRTHVTLEKAKLLGLVEVKKGVTYISESLGAPRLTSAAIISR